VLLNFKLKIFNSSAPCAHKIKNGIHQAEPFKRIPFKFFRAQLSLCGSGLPFALAVFFHKFLDSSGGINELLLASEKGVAVGANFHAQITSSISDFKRIPTRARNRSEDVFRMNFGFHNKSPLSFAVYRSMNIL
jgi:hypothetical protein